MDNTEVNISQEIPAYERRYRKISEWFLNCKPAYAILKFIYKYMAYFIAFAYIFLITDTRINDVKGVRISLDVSKNLSVSTTIPLFLNIIGVVSEKKVPRKLIITRRIYANAII